MATVVVPPAVVAVTVGRLVYWSVSVVRPSASVTVEVGPGSTSVSCGPVWAVVTRSP
jgi:hypothetical protein